MCSWPALFLSLKARIILKIYLQNKIDGKTRSFEKKMKNIFSELFNVIFSSIFIFTFIHLRYSVEWKVWNLYNCVLLRVIKGLRSSVIHLSLKSPLTIFQWFYFTKKLKKKNYHNKNSVWMNSVWMKHLVVLLENIMWTSTMHQLENTEFDPRKRTNYVQCF